MLLHSCRLHELHELKFPFITHLEFIRKKLSNFSAHVSGVSVVALAPALPGIARCLRWNAAPPFQCYLEVRRAAARGPLRGGGDETRCPFLTCQKTDANFTKHIGSQNGSERSPGCGKILPVFI